MTDAHALALIAAAIGISGAGLLVFVAALRESIAVTGGGR